MSLLSSVAHGWSQVVSTLQSGLGRSPKPSGGQQLSMLDRKGDPNALAWAETVTPTVAEVPPLNEPPGQQPMEPGLPPGVFASAPSMPVEGDAGSSAPEAVDATMPEHGQPDNPVSETPASVSFSDTENAGNHGEQVSATKISGDGYTKPRVKTMVEALPRDSSAPEGVDYLPDYLQDVFQKKVYVNPRVQALLVQHGTVDIRQLVNDLTSFAEEIGAR